MLCLFVGGGVSPCQIDERVLVDAISLFGHTLRRKGLRLWVIVLALLLSSMHTAGGEGRREYVANPATPVSKQM